MAADQVGLPGVGVVRLATDHAHLVQVHFAGLLLGNPVGLEHGGEIVGWGQTIIELS